MTLEDQARTIQRKIAEIETKCYRIAHLCTLVLTEHKINSDIFKFSDEDKQKLIQHYQTKKAQLKALVDELP